MNKGEVSMSQIEEAVKVAQELEARMRAKACTTTVPAGTGPQKPTTNKRKPKDTKKDGTTSACGGGKGDTPKTGNGGDDEPFFSRKEKKIAVLFLVFIVAFLLYWFAMQKMFTELISAVGMMSSNSSQQDDKQPHTGAGVSSSNKPIVSKAPKVVQARSVIQPLPFACQTDDQQVLSRLFSEATIHTLQDGVSLHAEPGCLLVNISAVVTELRGGGYSFAVPYSNSAGFDLCGKGNGGLNESDDTCIKFLNRHYGQELHVAVRNGGYVNIN